MVEIMHEQQQENGDPEKQNCFHFFCFRLSMVHEPIDGIQKAGSTTLPRGAGSSAPTGPPAQPPNTRKCPVHCNSLWSIWYGLAVLALQGYIQFTNFNKFKESKKNSR